MLIPKVVGRRNNIAGTALQMTVIGLGAVVSIFLLRFVHAPWVWISLAWFLIFLYTGLTTKRSIGKAIWVNVSFVVLAFGLFEAYLWITVPQLSMRYSDDYDIPHEILGHAPRKSVVASHVEYINNIKVFDVTYTIDSDGLRISPPHDSKNNQGALLFFGCSFTFGEGVQDNETMPYAVGLITHGRYAIYNFGFHAYGPNQMLSALEHGLVETIVQYPPKYVIYQAIPNHVERVAGLASYARHVPKYTHPVDGGLVYQGNFDEVSPTLIEKLSRAVRPIRAWIKTDVERPLTYLKGKNWYRAITSNDIELFIATVNKAKEETEARYPGSQFHVILWDKGFDRFARKEFLNQVLNGFKDHKINVHLISHIIPDFPDTSTFSAKYELHDHHPNTNAHRLIAEYVVKNILHD